MSAKYADIIIDISHEAIDRAFQYEVPDFLCDKIKIGMRVEIPFGKGNTIRTGFVIGFSDTPSFDADKIKAIKGILPEVAVEGQLIELAGWIRETYGATMYQALRTVLPVKKKVKPYVKREILLNVEREEGEVRLLEYKRKHSVAKARLLEALLEHKKIPYEIASAKLNISKSTIESLNADGTIALYSKEEYRKAYSLKEMEQKEPELNALQKKATDRFISDYENGERKTYLLYGVTGSGKTEVYMHMIDAVIKSGKQVIMLIPEIALTFQTVMRFRRHFGDRIAILHSRLSDGERFDQYKQIKNGEVDICIGPRSVLFAPFEHLGLIILDEEHEGSYKSENPPCYHARETAIKRAQMTGSSVVLGSATPSLQAFYRAQKGEYTLLELPERAVSGANLPEVNVVDMRVELRNGNRSRLSYILQEEIKNRLERGEQSILFMNKRGYASFVSCRSCGEAVTCPHCQVTLSYHDHYSGKPRLICHYCGYEESFVKKCRSCGSTMIGTFGSGTEQLEAELNERFPEARVLRMDADTTKGKDGHEKILSKFADGKADILVGTQMVVKGHDYENVTLVGIVAADQSLHIQDYTAGERTFQLLTQASGRAGRGRKSGQVIIQTYEPEHPVILSAAKQDYLEFYDMELAYRRLLHYPPVETMLQVLVTSGDERRADAFAKKLKKRLEEADATEGLHIVGPTTPVIGKIQDRYRRVFFVKHTDSEAVLQAKRLLESCAREETETDAVRVFFDLTF